NSPELRSQLAEMQVRSATDTEVVLHAYARWGPACIERFVGMYAFAIWDARERQLFCARDRLGIKPFYYARLGEHFLFASEIRPLLVAGVGRAVNEHVLYDYLSRDFYEHGDDTCFAGITKLPAGTWAYVRDGRVGPPRRYWSLAAEVEQQRVHSDPRQREETLLA